MKKVENLKKALAEIDAKVARLSYAREKMLSKLEELEAYQVKDRDVDSAVIGSPTGPKGTDAAQLQKMEFVSAGVAPEPNHEYNEMGDAFEGYFAEHPDFGELSRWAATVVCEILWRGGPMPKAQIIEAFVIVANDVRPFHTWGGKEQSEVIAIFDACLGAGADLVSRLPEGPNGRLETGPHTQ